MRRKFTRRFLRRLRWFFLQILKKLSYLRVEEIELLFEVLQWGLIGELAAKVLLADIFLNFFDNLKLSKRCREFVWWRRLPGLILNLDLEHLAVEAE